MKHLAKVQLWLFIPPLLTLMGCPLTTEDVIFAPEDTQYTPLLMTRTQLESSVSPEPPREINRPGKMYFKDGFLFLTEKYEGVHLIDNRDPHNPKRLSFVRIPGCVDIAMKGRTLYADNATDLIALDFSDVLKPRLVNRQPDVFPALPPPDLIFVPSIYQSHNRPENTVIVGWEK